MFLNAELAVYRRWTGGLLHGWDLELKGNVSHYYTCCCVCAPADYDEIILESRSSELLLRNFKSDISNFPQMLFPLRCCALLEIILSFVAGLWIWMLKSLHFLEDCCCRWAYCTNAGVCTTSLWNWRFHSPVVGFFYDDPRTCLTPCVDTRTWKGGPTGIAMAIRGRPVGVTNSLNRNWIYRNETFRG